MLSYVSNTRSIWLRCYWHVSGMFTSNRIFSLKRGRKHISDIRFITDKADINIKTTLVNHLWLICYCKLSQYLLYPVLVVFILLTKITTVVGSFTWLAGYHDSEWNFCLSIVNLVIMSISFKFACCKSLFNTRMKHGLK